MSTRREDFLQHICQTSASPLGLDIQHALGPFVFTRDGKKYLDLISGIGVVNIGHGRAEVQNAIETQTSKYLHPMVYGEFIVGPQVEYAKLLAQHLPGAISTIFFANSGTEAVEGALKTARKYTGRKKLCSFTNCYHGDTMGALSCQSGRTYRTPFEPLVPDIEVLPWNDTAGLEAIDQATAGVIIEPIQAEGGIRIPDAAFLQSLKTRCLAHGALLIFDEVMTGFGRTGKLFAAHHWDIEPDLVVLGKALGGGLPLGAFAGPFDIMRTLSENPPLAHVTTFGGNPVSCAAGLASLQIILAENLAGRADIIGGKFIAGFQKLKARHAAIVDVRGKGCLIGVEFATGRQTMRFAAMCLERGLIVGWTLHHSNILRMAPPLILTDAEIGTALGIAAEVLEQI